VAHVLDDLFSAQSFISKHVDSTAIPLKELTYEPVMSATSNIQTITLYFTGNVVEPFGCQ